MTTTLAVILPVYNEEGAIADVLDKWMKVLGALCIDFHIHAYNDGSKDNSLKILNHIASQSNGKLFVHDKRNSGHGPTILAGYRDNADTYEWLFQVDSDGEMGPESFASLWEQRNNYDFLLGFRQARYQPLPRKIISMFSRLCVRLFYGKGVWDVNSPYRLMRSSRFGDVFKRIPENTFAPNVILSGYVAKANVRYFEHPVVHGERQTGEVSIKKWKLLRAAMVSFFQTMAFSFSIGSLIKKPN